MKNIVKEDFLVRPYLQIIFRVMENLFDDVMQMTDEELDEDRCNWIRRYGDRDNDENKLDTDYQTLAIHIEQMKRKDGIQYDTEDNSV